MAKLPKLDGVRSLQDVDKALRELQTAMSKLGDENFAKPRRMDYSENEYNTGQTWVDGRAIHARTLPALYVKTDGSTTVTFNQSHSLRDVDFFVDLHVAAVSISDGSTTILPFVDENILNGNQDGSIAPHLAKVTRASANRENVVIDAIYGVWDHRFYTTLLFVKLR